MGEAKKTYSADAYEAYQQTLKENEALKDMCERLKKENNDLKAKYDTNCTRLQAVCDSSDSLREQLNKEIKHLEDEYSKIKGVYEKLDSRYETAVAEIATFKYCIEHIFGK